MVDASADWKDSRTRIGEVVARYPQIALTYLEAEVPSGAAQRNQGLEAVTSDVVFIFDDDTLMHPACAQNVLAVYAADGGGQVAGVQAGVADGPPAEFTTGERTKKRGSVSFGPGLLGGLQRWLLAHVILFNTGVSFIPYDETFPDREIPEAVHDVGARRAYTLFGFRATFRTEHAKSQRYDPALLSYSPGEDADMSYRVSRLGALVSLSTPDVHHYVSGSGRLDRRKVVMLAVANRSFFLRQHAVDLRSARRRFTILMLRRLLAELIKDGGSKRLTFPQFRGLLRAMPIVFRVFALPEDRLTSEYHKIQTRILALPN